jgi:hypothetical protein
VCVWGLIPSFQWRQPSLDVDVGDPNPDVVSFRATWTKYIQENKQKWKERAASGGCCYVCTCVNILGLTGKAVGAIVYACV